MAWRYRSHQGVQPSDQRPVLSNGPCHPRTDGGVPCPSPWTRRATGNHNHQHVYFDDGAIYDLNHASNDHCPDVNEFHEHNYHIYDFHQHHYDDDNNNPPHDDHIGSNDNYI